MGTRGNFRLQFAWRGRFRGAPKLILDSSKGVLKSGAGRKGHRDKPKATLFGNVTRLSIAKSRRKSIAASGCSVRYRAPKKCRLELVTMLKTLVPWAKSAIPDTLAIE